MQNYSALAERAKRNQLGNAPYWYFFVIGRDPDHVGRSVSPSLILPFIHKARDIGVPLWLEATSKHSRDIYTKLGFEVVEELKVGKGSCDGKGNLVQGGEGVTMWAMVNDHC
jgi:hypothetical protein